MRKMAAFTVETSVAHRYYSLMINTEKSNYLFANLNWKDLDVLRQKGDLLLLLPIGSTESHGPHAPLCTDALISLEVCLRSAKALTEKGHRALVLPALTYAVTECARSFPGTVSISPEVDSGMISDLCLSLIRQGMTRICLFNSHFEPTHVQCLYDAIERIERSSGIRIAFTDVTRKKYSSQLPSAFRRGETHADRYETSAIMAIDRSLINDDRRKALPCLPISLVDKLFKEKLSDFLEFGMEESYCGDPASATTEEGELILETLSRLVVQDAEQLLDGTQAPI
jgi:creatinine amidohydrolase